MERCPNCRAQNPGIEQCRRCGMDLALLCEVEAAAQRLVHRALWLLIHNRAEAAPMVQQILKQARALQHDHLVTVLQGFAATAGAEDSTEAQLSPSLPSCGGKGPLPSLASGKLRS